MMNTLARAMYVLFLTRNALPENTTPENDMSNADEQAFPIDTAMYRSLGLTKREHAAILLRVPKSGDDEIDAMIIEANRRDAAAMVVQAYAADEAWREDIGPTETARAAVFMADALIAELERTA